jgi:ABC-type transporter Mla maintaining outer membrane lipid asymmetry permease subunit MlaE
MVGIIKALCLAFLLLQFLLFRGFNTKGGALEGTSLRRQLQIVVSRYFVLDYLLAELLT